MGGEKAAKPKAQKTLNLALQGGGSHGAFTWGVLDALLEDGRIDFEGVSATSAGAMNAAALAYGKSTGGAEKAREVLETFWREISNTSAFYNPSLNNSLEFMKGLNPFAEHWPSPKSGQFMAFEAVKNMFSPYQLNPLNINLLQEVLERVIDFDAVHQCACLELFINATNVCTGTSKIFRNQDVTIDVLLASACLPYLFRAQDIDGQAYWDGGYMGNPALWPLFYHAKCRDILIIHLNPIVRDEVPTEAYAIENRVNEITFNTALMKELRAIAFVKKLINEDMLKDEYKDRYKDVYLHAIRADQAMAEFSITSKFDTDWGFLTTLRDKGREEAQAWLKSNYKYINKKASVDIEKDYLGQ